MRVYNIRLNLKWDDASQTYSVTSPDVPELFTFGSNLIEIQANVKEAIDLLLAAMDARGEPRPPVLIPVEQTRLTLPVAA